MRTPYSQHRFPHLRLQWRMTLSYVLVTVLVALCLELLVIVLACVSSTMALTPRRVLAYVEGAHGALAPYLTATPPNRDALYEWLRNGKTGARQNVDLPYSAIIDFAHVPQPIIAVTGNDGRVLACVPRTAFTPDEGLADQLPRSHGRVVRAALHGDVTPEHLAFRATGMTVTASPIRDHSGKQVGVVYVRLHTVTSFAHLLKSLREIVFPLSIIVLLSAAIGGTLFGYRSARRITRRLQHIATAADAWRQGDFRARAEEHGGDELGQMAGNLNRMAEELQALFSLRQELAMLDERNRLARDLHDTVKQQVFATVMQLGAVQALLEKDPATARKHLTEAEHLAHQAQFDLGAILRELRSTLPLDKGLAVALRGHVADWARQTGITAEVSGALELRLSPITEEALFRITQEALANVARHSKATRAQVVLDEKAGRVMLQIIDNGCGFTIGSSTPGMGLRNMRERAEALPHGALDVSSEPGVGTRLTVVCTNEGGENAGSTI